MSISQRTWNALKNVTIIISLAINIVLIAVVLILISQIGAIKSTLNAVLLQLDQGFVALGNAEVRDSIHIDQGVPVSFDLPVDQNVTVVTTAPVPLSIPASFSLGPFGQINGTVSLSLPQGLALPIRISMVVPVQTEIAVTFDQPVTIPLGQRGLAPVIDQFRGVTQPLIQLVNEIPDSIP